jgi:type IV secretion system protein VirD4
MKPNNDFSYERHGTEGTHDKSFSDAKLNIHDIRTLLEVRSNPVAQAKLVIFLVGLLATPLSLLGLCWGYSRAYLRLWRPYRILPRLNNLPLIFKVAMAIGVVAVWTICLTTIWLIATLVPDYSDRQFVVLYLLVNGSFSAAVFVVFRRWQAGINNLLMLTGEHGSARWAREYELEEYMTQDGLFIGGPFSLPSLAHVLLVAGTRGGKAAMLLINAILGVGGYKGSMCIIDPKAELASVTARALRAMGKRVVIINPWDILGHLLKAKNAYNPLDLLADISSPHIPDDLDIISEMLVPKKVNDRNSFFTDSARHLISTLLLHIVCTAGKNKATLTRLWEMLRYFGAEWDNLIAEMGTSKHSVHGAAIRNGARAIMKQMESPETFASILSNALEATSFLKSGPLQESLVSDFDPYTLADGNTFVFIVIPVDKLSSHSAWLRLVTTSMLRSVVRKPGERVTFLYDEAGNLGYMSEIPTALAAYAGFNITMWLVYQDLSQIKAAYGDKWETVVANCSIRQFASLRDNFTQKYVSEALGKTTTTLYKRDWMGNILEVKNTARELATPDEVRTISQDNIILFAGENDPVKVRKVPYYENPLLKKNGQNIYDSNPYIRNSK